MTTPQAGVAIVECVEYGHIDIDPELWFGEGNRMVLNSEIDGKDVLRASFAKGVLRLQATSFVGIIPINSRVIVRVRPRVPLRHLTRMVTETGHEVLALSAFREYAGRGTADDWVMDRYADALLDYVDEVIDRGLLRAYERREAAGHFPHGRLEFGQTLQRFTGRGIPNKVAYSWFERTVDTPVNRTIKAALLAIHSHLTKVRAQPRKGDRSKLARLAGQLMAFEEVSEDTASRHLQDPQVLGLVPLPDHRAYYRPVLDLASVILRGVGIALDVGGQDVIMRSLLVNTNELFEKFVRATLRKRAIHHRWPVDVLDGNTEGKVDLYDVPLPLPAPFGVPLVAAASRNAGKAQPDVVLRAPGGSFLLVAEVKNTVISDEALPDRSHVEQAVTYALRYDLGFALLIHPWSQGTKGLVYIGRVRTIDVYDYRLDLSAEDHLDDALSDMSDVVARLAGLDMH